MMTDEIKKGVPFVLADCCEYVPKSVVTKTILRKATGVITILSVDTGKSLTERTTPFDTFILIIDGAADITLSASHHAMTSGQCLIIPAHERHSLVATAPCKLISTIMKSGYEEIEL